MQKKSGVTRILEVSFVYDLFQEIVGANAARRHFVEQHVRAKRGNKIVDVGCGPAQVLRWLPDVQYVGLDVSESYIAAAQKKYGTAGTFLVGSTNAFWDDPRVMGADLVLCAAVLHHLNDAEVLQAFRFARRILKPGGRFLSVDPCWIPSQGLASKWVMSRDRGQNIRTEDGYRALAAIVFPDVKTTIGLRPLRIPTTDVVLECGM